MAELARERGLVLAEAMTIYHMPIFKKIAQMIDDGELGRIKMVKADLGSLKEDDPTNRFFNPELGGGAMLDIGTYALSFLRYFLRGQLRGGQLRHPGLPPRGSMRCGPSASARTRTSWGAPT